MTNTSYNTNKWFITQIKHFNLLALQIEFKVVKMQTKYLRQCKSNISNGYKLFLQIVND